MPETTRPTSAAAEFAELVCADPVLLHAEFEAIVAANFPTPPLGERPPRGESGAPTRVPAGLARPGVDYLDVGGTAHAMSTLRRQRSPPPLTIPRKPEKMGKAGDVADRVGLPAVLRDSHGSTGSVRRFRCRRGHANDPPPASRGATRDRSSVAICAVGC